MWIVIRPLFDDVTVYSFMMGQRIVDELERLNIEYVDLPRSRTIRDIVEYTIRNHPLANVAHFDHGGVSAWYGQDAKPCVDLDNIDLLINKECFAMNCSSAKVLGKEAFEKGANVYWGYTEEVSFTTDALDDFVEAFTAGLMFRLQGFSWQESLAKTKQFMTDKVTKLTTEGKVFAAMTMRNDRDILVCYEEGYPPQEPECPVSRIIWRLSSWNTLEKLRRVRDRIKSFIRID